MKYIAALALAWTVLPSGAAAIGDAETDSYVVNGVEFRVPREYQWLGKTPPDQNPAEGQRIFLMMHANDMSPGSVKDDPSNNVNITVESPSSLRVYPLKDGSAYPPHLVKYWALADLSSVRNFGQRDVYYELSAEPIYITHAFGLDYYKLPRRDDGNTITYDFFIKGDVFKPDYWIACTGLRCESSYALTDGTNINYSFDAAILHMTKHEQLREQLTEKLKSFIATKP